MCFEWFERLVSALALLILSTAFDTLYYAILLKRLEVTFGVRGTALDWFRSYMCSREQSVIVDRTVSSPPPA